MKITCIGFEASVIEKFRLLRPKETFIIHPPDFLHLYWRYPGITTSEHDDCKTVKTNPQPTGESIAIPDNPASIAPVAPKLNYDYNLFGNTDVGIIAGHPGVYCPEMIFGNSGDEKGNTIPKALSSNTFTSNAEGGYVLGLFRTYFASFFRSETCKELFVYCPPRFTEDEKPEVLTCTPLGAVQKQYCADRAFRFLFRLPLSLDSADDEDIGILKLQFCPLNDYDCFRYLKNIEENPFWRVLFEELSTSVPVKKNMEINCYKHPKGQFDNCIIFKHNGKSLFLMPPPSSADDVTMLLNCIVPEPASGLKAREKVKEIYAAKSGGTDFPIVGAGKAMDYFFCRMHIAGIDRTGHALITGETGSGKELAADVLHTTRFGKTSPYITTNCAHLPGNLAYSTIFGHVKGAYTDAKFSRKGLIKEADGGTLFLDEVHMLDDQCIGMLLRYMETGEYYMYGSDKKMKSKAVLIAATNSETFVADNKLTKSGFLPRFRHTINIPPLRFRMEDISCLSEYFYGEAVKEFQRNYGCAVLDSILDEFKVYLPSLEATDWKNSNIRGLKSAVYDWFFRRMAELQITNPGTIVENPVRNAGRPKGKFHVSDAMLYDMMKNLNDSTALKNEIRNKVKTGYGSKDPYNSMESLRRRIHGFEDESRKNELLEMISKKGKGKFCTYPKDKKKAWRNEPVPPQQTPENQKDKSNDLEDEELD